MLNFVSLASKKYLATSSPPFILLLWGEVVMKIKIKRIFIFDTFLTNNRKQSLNQKLITNLSHKLTFQPMTAQLSNESSATIGQRAWTRVIELLRKDQSAHSHDL